MERWQKIRKLHPEVKTGAGPRPASKPGLDWDSSTLSDTSTSVEVPDHLVGTSFVQKVNPPAKSTEMHPGLPLKEIQWYYKHRSVIHL